MDRETIIIIDDEAPFRKTLSDIFKLRGFETLDAGNGAEGLALLEDHAVDVVLVDLGLPDIPGIDILYRAKTLCPATEVIILTGNATLDSAIEATNRGAFCYLLKPCDIDQLLDQVRRAVVKRRAGEQAVRRREELERDNSELRALHEVSLACSRITELGDLLPEVSRTLARIRPFPFDMEGSIHLVDETESLPQRGTLVHAGCIGSDRQPCRPSAVPDGIVLSPCPDGGGHILCDPGLPPHGHAIVPLRLDGRPVGVLCLSTPPGFTPDEEMLRVLAEIAGQIGTGIGNARLYEETRASSLHDSLTGLANRRFMEVQLEKVFEVSKRYGRPLSLVMMDIDHFKHFNDTHGHQEGDLLLARVAAVLARETRYVDYLFRYGGEEFLAILPDADCRMAVGVAERVRRAIETETPVTISLGVAAYGRNQDDRNELVRMADDALYLAKRNGRNRVEVAFCS